MPELKEAAERTEQVQNISIKEIHPFSDHPFSVTDDDLMQQTVESIKQFGIMNPAIIRPDPSGGYEMVSGHRRLRAARLAGMNTIPAIVRKLTDDEAVILLVDSNLQRENMRRPPSAATSQRWFNMICMEVTHGINVLVSFFMPGRRCSAIKQLLHRLVVPP